MYKPLRQPAITANAHPSFSRLSTARLNDGIPTARFRGTLLPTISSHPTMVPTISSAVVALACWKYACVRLVAELQFGDKILNGWHPLHWRTLWTTANEMRKYDRNSRHLAKENDPGNKA
jgi:hypothetical protein